MTAESTHDIVIMGGGLAGLTLALQLRRRDPALDVLVIERRSHPVPVACHKVGESSVEIGAHYFEQVLGLKQHLDDQQLRKFGFRFFFSEGERDIARVTELGASRPLPTPSYQIDRGVFENFLAEECRRQGVGFVDGALIRQLTLGEDDAPHVVDWQRPGAPLQRSRARWVIDACGRAGLIKRQLGLARENAHGCHAVWFRIRERIRIDDWSADPAWRARCVTPTRWLSTNHLVGAGYWVWLIPLSSGSHSVGIVADPRFHPLESMNTFDKAMDWLRQYQPALYADLEGKRDALQDFAFLRRFSYDCTQVFSAQRWALAGEAGRFLDPFYSPGSDFIAIGNTYITELVMRDRAGQPLAAHVQIYEQIFRSFYDSTLALYTDQYGLFGDPEVLPTKVIWDYTYYWSVLAPLFFQQRLGDLATLSHLREVLMQCKRLNAAVQDFLRAWGEASPRRNRPVMLDQASAPWFVELNRGLRDPLDAEAFRARVRTLAGQLQSLAAQIVQRATREHPQLDASALRALLPPLAADGRAEPLLFAPPDAAGATAPA
ncbi:MAG: NAD(P)/FAD-dependent oxidoreductase [Piscinibacter sp.]|uniref:NAD(P)/FAD-dependent oxidoreductase n=1 Tax=Piscinibacter TaxID=1114981 RepID=UPI000FDEF20D|nr:MULTISPECIES: NAD(P)/FAD-dependent oxidoreductase [Piscinibacter]MCW5664891.1 NAD(P)/FAD-dependent oxidoreductase [Piscinibacter sp.]